MGIADGCISARLWDRNDEVSVGRKLTSQPSASVRAHFFNLATRDPSVRPSQVDKLEQTAFRLSRGEALATHTRVIDLDEFAWLDFTHEGGTDDVEGCRFARYHPPLLQPAQHQRTDTVRITSGIQGVLIHKDQRKRPCQIRQYRQRGIGERPARMRCQQRRHQFGV